MNPVARRETPLAIAALVLWVLTAAAGLVLFITGSAARRARGAQAPGQQPPDSGPRTADPRAASR